MNTLIGKGPTFSFDQHSRKDQESANLLLNILTVYPRKRTSVKIDLCLLEDLHLQRTNVRLVETNFLSSKILQRITAGFPVVWCEVCAPYDVPVVSTCWVISVYGDTRTV